jgi:hypothetical protein
MKVSFPLSMRNAHPSPINPQATTQLHSHKFQRLGQYSLAIALGSLLPQFYPAIARSMALEEKPQASLDIPPQDTSQEMDSDVDAFAQNPGAPPSDSDNDVVALTLALSPADPESADSSTVPAPNSESGIESLPETTSESVYDEPPSDPSPSGLWPFKPSPQRDAAQPDVTRDRATPNDSFLSPATGQQLDQLFAGGTDSLVAKAVGSAEGTRTPEGDKTWAYYGHTDPGNGVYNLGTFSYQHGASSPDDADQRQLLRLKSQARQIQDDAESRRLTLGIAEQLNAIDLANQAPKAALSSGGYLDRLQEAYQMGLRGDEAILWARVRSYIDPSTQRWNAPGLGNNFAQIEADQRRRMDAIARAVIAAGEPTATESYSFNHLPEPQPMPRSPAAPSANPVFPGAVHFPS